MTEEKVAKAFTDTSPEVTSAMMELSEVLSDELAAELSAKIDGFLQTVLSKCLEGKDAKERRIVAAALLVSLQAVTFKNTHIIAATPAAAEAIERLGRLYGEDVVEMFVAANQPGADA